MSLPQLLFIIRLLSAALLLGFLGFIAYTLYRDAQSVRVRETRGQKLGTLRIVEGLPEGAPPGTCFSLSAVNTIGRGERSTIVLDDSYVSQEHARLVRRDGRWWLDDLGSRNGTLLNDVPLTVSTVVSAGDIITIGRVAMLLEAGEAE